MSRFMIAALYHFVPLDDLPSLRQRLFDACAGAGVKGTILLSELGINGTISAEEPVLRRVLAFMRSDARLADLVHKESWSEETPFLRLKVRIRKEIVTMGVPGVDPAKRVGTYVKPKDWNALINQPDVVLVDTRNTYETEIGTFRGAVDPRTESFTEFPAWVKSHPEIGPETKIAMFCTGGIRCEKATSYLVQEGYEHVYHLEGGILKYLEDVPREESMWDGECYVFDRRVTVDHDLKPGRYEMCMACGRTLSVQAMKSPLYIPGVACAKCHAQTSEAQKESFRERQRQVEMLAQRNQVHIGEPMPAKPKMSNE